jgi:hypothetical protein
MLKLKLNVKERGYVVNIPGLPAFRTPGKVDITNYKLPLILSILNNLGIKEYEISSADEKGEMVYTKKDLEINMKKDKSEIDISKIDERFNKLEKILYLLAEKESKKVIPEEQITKKLNTLEALTKKLLEKEAVQNIVYTNSKDKGNPTIEEIDDSFIPEININDLKLKGESTKTVDGDTESAEKAADMLSRLGGK